MILSLSPGSSLHFPVHRRNNVAYVWISFFFHYWNFIFKWLKFCQLINGLIQERLEFHCPTSLRRLAHLFICPLFALSTLALSFVTNSVPNGKRKFWWLLFMRILLRIFPRGSGFGGWIFLTGEENGQFHTAKILVTIAVFLMRVTDSLNIVEFQNELCLSSGKLKFLRLKFVY